MYVPELAAEALQNGRSNKGSPTRRTGYYGLIENVDYTLGRIRQHLETLGITGSTYLIYFSDHGDHHSSHGPFRKLTPYAESIDVPFIIGGPCNNHSRLQRIVDARPTRG